MAAIQQTYTKRERMFVAVSAVLGYGLDFYNLIIMAFLIVPIQQSLNISLPQAGLIVSMTLAASVAGGLLFGWLGDQIGRKNALLATLLLLAAGAILSAMAWNFASLLIFRIIAGIGVGGEWGAGMVLFNEVWDSKRRGFGSSIVQASSSAGIALASIVATFALTQFGTDMSWRIALLVGGLPLILMLFVRSKMPESRLWSEYNRLKEAGELPPEKMAESAPILEIFKGAALRYFIFGTIVAGGYIINYQSISIFMPLLMSRDLGADPAAIRGLTLLFALVSAIGMLATGYISDMWGRKLAITIATLVGVMAVIGIYLTGGERYPGSFLVWSLFWCYVVWGFGQGAIGQFGPWFAELYPVELRSTAASTIFTMGRLVGSTAPYLVPALAVSTGLLNAMMLALVGSAISLVCLFFLPETVGRPFAVIEGKERVDVAPPLSSR
jgi:MFS family permease